MCKVKNLYISDVKIGKDGSVTLDICDMCNELPRKIGVINIDNSYEESIELAEKLIKSLQEVVKASR